MVEIVKKGSHANAARVVLFDFDGTVSLVRAGWMDLMAPMMVEFLLETKSGETEAELHDITMELIGRTTGKETIYQMIELADMIKTRGGQPREAVFYKRTYLDLLNRKIAGRISGLETGSDSPEKYLVPGSRQLLESLQSRGLKMVLASGTDDPNVKQEAKLLQIDHFFNGGIFGAYDDPEKFSKARLVKEIIATANHTGEEFLGFGDGFVEIEAVKAVGGVAVGVASNEPECLQVDDWKRNRLVGVGADWIVPNYIKLDTLMQTIFPA